MVQSSTLISGRYESQRLVAVSLGLTDLSVLPTGCFFMVRTWAGFCDERPCEGQEKMGANPGSAGIFAGAVSSGGINTPAEMPVRPEKNCHSPSRAKISILRRSRP